MVVLDVDPSDEGYALEVARALRRSPSPGGGTWLSVPAASASALSDELARMEALFFDLELEGAERAARETLQGIEAGVVPVEEHALLLRTLLRAAQIFDARGADAEADDALRHASAVQPAFELSASDFPPSLIARRARLQVSDQRHTLRLEGLGAEARVSIDGTPTRARTLQLPEGAHVVSVWTPGHRLWQRVQVLDTDATLTPAPEIDRERLHALAQAEAQRFLALHDAQPVRLRVVATPAGREASLVVPGEPAASVSVALTEEPAALAARLLSEHEAESEAESDARSRRRRRRALGASLGVAVLGAGTGAYVGLRPEAEGWRGSGALAGDPAP